MAGKLKLGLFLLLPFLFFGLFSRRDMNAFGEKYNFFYYYL